MTQSQIKSRINFLTMRLKNLKSSHFFSNSEKERFMKHINTELESLSNQLEVNFKEI